MRMVVGFLLSYKIYLKNLLTNFIYRGTFKYNKMLGMTSPPTAERLDKNLWRLLP